MFAFSGNVLLVGVFLVGSAHASPPEVDLMENDGLCDGGTATHHGEAICENRDFDEHDCRKPGCCIYDQKQAQCFFCGDLLHDPGCGGDGKGFVKNSKGVWVNASKLHNDGDDSEQSQETESLLSLTQAAGLLSK